MTPEKQEPEQTKEKAEPTNTGKTMTPEIQEPERRKLKMEQYNLITAAATAIIAIAAFCVSLMDGCETRKHNKLSVAPLLDYSSTQGAVPFQHDSGFYKIDLANKGLGPAIISKYEIFYNEKPITSETRDANFNDLLAIAVDEAICYHGLHKTVYARSLSEGSVIQPNDTLRLLDAFFIGPDSANVQTMIQNLKNLNIRISYTSIYHDKIEVINLIKKDPSGGHRRFMPANYNYFRSIYPHNHPSN